eukprot:CAMPEP_0177272600 /NCGR_PEP_ID=MMETSP0367-20130122/66170_1 /TAXON_ID=447022 ORGANISM="Scrippsiella hangoei-like, Strain SHHI-4" /NCGR_SAMPLE_ID=MMETSP0367 /ASSEMBLY_ACC=CAM_ASM_000362 /LENGTH=259 /DNA_ID=CAMNT_0018728779 /DNA_START=70 /DNA_END=847 /DNA_ORIENTATION=-
MTCVKSSTAAMPAPEHALGIQDDLGVGAESVQIRFELAALALQHAVAEVREEPILGQGPQGVGEGLLAEPRMQFAELRELPDDGLRGAEALDDDRVIDLGTEKALSDQLEMRCGMRTVSGRSGTSAMAGCILGAPGGGPTDEEDAEAGTAGPNTASLPRPIETLFAAVAAAAPPPAAPPASRARASGTLAAPPAPAEPPSLPPPASFAWPRPTLGRLSSLLRHPAPPLPRAAVPAQSTAATLRKDAAPRPASGSSCTSS